MNLVILLGNLCSKPELRYTTTGTAICNIRLAVNSRYTSKTGEKKDEVLFCNVNVWGRHGESCAEYLDKGSKILVEGRLQSREWQDKQGLKRTVMEVTAKSVTFLTHKDKDGRSELAPVEPYNESNDDVPF